VSERKYWLGFSLVPEIGPKRLALLVRAFGALEAAWQANEHQLRAAGFDGVVLGNILEMRRKLKLDAEVERVEKAGARLLILTDDDYPPLLKTLADAPPVLYIRGTLRPEDQRALGIVGTRKATTYGRDVAADMAQQLARHKVTVVSGLAHGIDAAAHRGAIDGDGRTLAVMGCGVDVTYPSDHRALAEHVMEHGALVSEFPMGTRPESRNFPRRNRLISGLSLGVLVIEAPERSGALITAETAAEQGRDVFAVPGSIYNAMSTGANRLIQDGAKLVMKVSDILDELNIAHQTVENRQTAERIAPAGGTETEILNRLAVEPIHIDDLVRSCGLPVAIVTSTLTILELKGLARSVGAMQYCLPHH
jgi:DNA processing protein